MYVIAVCRNRFHLNMVNYDACIESDRQQDVSIRLVKSDNRNKILPPLTKCKRHLSGVTLKYVRAMKALDFLMS